VLGVAPGAHAGAREEQMAEWTVPGQPEATPAAAKKPSVTIKAQTCGSIGSSSHTGETSQSQTEVRWQWEHATGFRNYDKDCSRRIESAYWRGDHRVRLKSGKTGSVPMELFFKDMIQYDPITERQRTIRRDGPTNHWHRAWRAFATIWRGAELGQSQRVGFNEYWTKVQLETTRRKGSETILLDRMLEGSPFTRLVRSRCFLVLSCFVVCINSLWIAVEAELNPEPTVVTSELHWQVGEHFFCCFFTFEIAVRYLSFRLKWNAFKDGWFCFDLFLVICTIAETWLLALVLVLMGDAEDASQSLGQVGLFRLLRIGRISRLLRFFPDIILLVRGISRAMRTVFSALLLLLLLLVVFGIAFKNLAHKYDDLAQPHLFLSLRSSMWVLLLQGVFVDDITEMMQPWREKHQGLAILFIVFVFLSCYTVMNMLIGILCDVVSQTSKKERDSVAVAQLTHCLREILESHDSDNDGHIQRDEFELLMKNPEMRAILRDVGVDFGNLQSLKHVLFAESEVKLLGGDASRPVGHVGSNKSMLTAAGDFTPERMTSRKEEERDVSFDEFIDVILRLRGGNTSTVADMVYLREFIRTRLDILEEEMRMQRYMMGTAELKASESSPKGGGDTPSQVRAVRAAERLHSECQDGFSGAVPIGVERPPQWAERILQHLEELDAGQRELREEVRDLRGRLCQSPSINGGGSDTLETRHKTPCEPCLCLPSEVPNQQRE
jgi:hypothetical protein